MQSEEKSGHFVCKLESRLFGGGGGLWRFKWVWSWVSATGRGVIHKQSVRDRNKGIKRIYTSNLISLLLLSLTHCCLTRHSLRGEQWCWSKYFTCRSGFTFTSRWSVLFLRLYGCSCLEWSISLCLVLLILQSVLEMYSQNRHDESFVFGLIL